MIMLVILSDSGFKAPLPLFQLQMCLLSLLMSLCFLVLRCSYRQPLLMSHKCMMLCMLITWLLTNWQDRAEYHR